MANPIPLQRQPAAPHLPDRVDRFRQMIGGDQNNINWWEAVVPAGTTTDDLMRPEFWAHVQRRIRVNDIITVLCDDGTMELEFRVTGSQGSAVYLRLRQPWYQGRPLADSASVDAQEPPADPDKRLPRVEWGGPAHRWRVLGLDGTVVHHGSDSKELAQQELARLFPASARVA